MIFMNRKNLKRNKYSFKKNFIILVLTFLLVIYLFFSGFTFPSGLIDFGLTSLGILIVILLIFTPANFFICKLRSRSLIIVLQIVFAVFYSFSFITILSVGFKHFPPDIVYLLKKYWKDYVYYSLTSLSFSAGWDLLISNIFISTSQDGKQEYAE